MNQNLPTIFKFFPVSCIVTIIYDRVTNRFLEREFRYFQKESSPRKLCVPFSEFLPHFRDVIPSLTFLFSWLMDLSLPLPTFIPTHPCFFPFSREWFEKSAANSRNSSANGAEIVERAKSIIAGILAARENRYLIIGRGAFTNYCGNRFVSRLQA